MAGDATDRCAQTCTKPKAAVHIFFLERTIIGHPSTPSSHQLSHLTVILSRRNKDKVPLAARLSSYYRISTFSNKPQSWLATGVCFHASRAPISSCTTILTVHPDDEESSGSSPSSPQIIARRSKFDDEEEEGDVSATTAILAAQQSLIHRSGP